VSIVASKSELMQLKEEMDEQSAAFETAPAGLIVAWAADRFGSKLTMASSFQEAVLIVRTSPRRSSTSRPSATATTSISP
jgi:hypothetical protein